MESKIDKTKVAIFSSSYNNEEYKHLETEELELVPVVGERDIKIIVCDEADYKSQLKRIAKFATAKAHGDSRYNDITIVALKISNGRLRFKLQEILENYSIISEVILIRDLDISLLMKYREILSATRSMKEKKVVLYKLMKHQLPVKCEYVARIDNVKDLVRLVEVSNDLVIYLDPSNVTEYEMLIIQSYFDRGVVRFVEKPSEYYKQYGTFEPRTTIV